LEALKKSATFTAATAALGEGFDRLREVEGARFRQLLIQLIPLRRFVADNQEPLRRIAINTRQMRWMLPYIDLIVPGVQRDEPTEGMELSFDWNDPECVAETRVNVHGPAGKVERSWLATSIRLRVQANSKVTLPRVMAYITKIEKLTAGREWQESSSPDIQLIWVGDTPFVEIPASSIKYVNTLHINQNDNRLAVWQTQLPSSLEDFLRDAGTYRFTVSVFAEGVTRHARIEVDWKGKWDTIKVRAA
jgi:hypothetical protein